MIINIKKNRIAAMVFILLVFLTYSWLLVWTTKAVIKLMDKTATNKDHYVNTKGNDKQISAFLQQGVAIPQQPLPEGKIYRLGNTSKLQIQLKQNVCQQIHNLSKIRWFKARFNSEIQPVWTEEGISLQDDLYDWWLSLQNSKGMDTVKFLQNLFKLGIPKTNPYKRENTDERSQCRKCAVVGNSGNLLHSGYGKIIDKHDFVIRMNKAPVSDFESDVGGKTTHRFMYPESSMDLPSGVSFVLTPFKPMDIKWLLSALTTAEVRKTYMNVPHRISCEVSKVIILSPTFIRYVHDRWTQHHGRYPSTGLIAVIYALHECDEINLFGFGGDKNGNWHHYWEDLPSNVAGAFKATGVHDSTYEKNLLDHMHSQGVVNLYTQE